MNLIWRFLSMLLFSKYSSSVDFLEKGVTTFTVLPTDVDVLRHMNNGRYFSLMDLARINFMIRNKIFYKLKEYKIYPVVASEMIRFKKSLLLFQRFQITTRIMGWDEKFFYIIHFFKRKGQIHAMSVVKARMLHQSGEGISPDALLSLLNIPNSSPPLAGWIRNWQQADQAFFEETVETNV